MTQSQLDALNHLACYLDDALGTALEFNFGLAYDNGPELALFLAEYLLDRAVELPYLYDYRQRLAGTP